MSIILSIIIPVYNVEKYIFKTLDSIYSQEILPNGVEVIVINDGTPDSSMEIVEQFRMQYKNIIVVNQENQGLSGARNTGIHKAKGKYLWFVDSDDMIENGILDKMLPLLNKGDEDIYTFKIREYDELGNVLTERKFLDNQRPEFCSGLEMIRRTARYRILHTPMQMHVIRTEFLRDNGLEFVRGIYHEDIEFAPRMLLAANKVCYVPWVAYKYVKRGSGSITTNPQLLEKRIRNLIQIAESHLSIMNSLEGQKKRIFSFAIYRVIAYIHAHIPNKKYRQWYREFGIKTLRGAFNRVVLMNLYYDHLWTRPPRQLIYIISPYLLKKMKMNI